MKKKDLSDVASNVKEDESEEALNALTQKMEQSVQQLQEHYDNANPGEIESLILDPETKSLRSKLLAQIGEFQKSAAEVIAKAEAASSEISQRISFHHPPEHHRRKRQSENQFSQP